MTVAAPRGRLTRKTQRQLIPSAMRAPAPGPARLVTPQTLLNTPWMRARSSMENRSPTMVIVTGSTAPAPRPRAGAGDDDLGQAAGDAAEHRADHEQHAAEDENGFAAIEVGELAVQGHRDRGSQQVDGERPAEVGEAAP